MPAQASPEELPGLVESHRLAGTNLVAAEQEIREAYDLPQARNLAARSWTDRARDLVRDGWARIRGLFRESEPEPPAPVDWDEIAAAPHPWEADLEVRRQLGQVASDLRPPETLRLVEEEVDAEAQRARIRPDSHRR